MTPPRILIAGIGNIFLGDDAFGTEVAQRLLQRPQLSGVEVIDFGIRGLDLAYALLDPWDAVLLIDACPRGDAPGTLYVIEPQVSPGCENEGTQRTAMAAGTQPDTSHIPHLTSHISPDPSDLFLDPHNLDPARVLRAVAAMGGQLNRLFLLGCEPSPRPPEGPDDMTMDMHPAVYAAIEPAVALAESIVARLAAGQDPCGDKADSAASAGQKESVRR